MIKVVLKDGSVKEIEQGKLIIEVAKEISPSLAKKSLVGKINGVLVDLKTPINEDCNLELVLCLVGVMPTRLYKEKKYIEILDSILQ